MLYLIRINGHLDASWQPWFDPLQLDCEPAGTTVLTGVLPDQAALFGIVRKIERLGMTLLTLESFDDETALKGVNGVEVVSEGLWTLFNA